MSRIEEALRRSGAAGARPIPADERDEEAQPPAASPPAQQGEEAPWTFDETSRSRIEARVAAQDRRDGHGDPGPVLPAGTPGLAPFSGFSPAVIEKIIVGDRVAPATVEQYRKLAATLHHAQIERGIRVLMVASALPDEGKTLTSTNLALTLSESYRRRVLLIDADLRRPSLHEVFQVPNVAGLSDGLNAASDHKLSLIQVTPLFSLLTAGKPEPDPVGALTSGRMRHILAEAAATFDWVIVDTPPVGLLTDANLLAAMVDVALVVVRAGVTPYGAVQRAVETIGRDRVLGVVLNGVDESTMAREYAYGYGYDYMSRRRGRGKSPGAR